MRKILFIGVLASVTLLLMPAAPAGSGESGRLIEVTKVVEGDGPTDGYAVEVDCEVEGLTGFDISDGETVEVSPQSQTGETCTITETDDQGADDVSYECIEGSLGDEDASCDESNVVSWEGDFTGDAEVIITNTFDPEPTTTTTTTTAPSTTTTSAAVAPVAAAVVATPAFTG